MVKPQVTDINSAVRWTVPLHRAVSSPILSTNQVFVYWRQHTFSIFARVDFVVVENVSCSELIAYIFSPLPIFNIPKNSPESLIFLFWYEIGAFVDIVGGAKESSYGSHARIF